LIKLLDHAAPISVKGALGFEQMKTVSYMATEMKSVIQALSTL